MEHRRLIFVSTLIGLVIAGAVVLLVMGPGVGGPGRSATIPIVGLVVTAGLVMVVVFVMLAVRTHKRQQLRFRARAEELGESVGLKFDHDPEKGFHRRYTFLPEVKKSGKTTRLARGEIAGWPALFFEHSYIVSTGQTTVTVYHCVYATDAPNWPDVHVTPRHPLSKLLRAVGIRRGMLLDDPNFNHAFTVKTDDEPFAVTLLTPDVQRLMLENTRVRWRFTRERVFTVYKGQLKLDRMPLTIDRLERFWSLVPPEVRAWERPAVV